MLLLARVSALTWIFGHIIFDSVNGCFNVTNWKEQSGKYEALIKFLDGKVRGLEPGSRTLKFINWQDKVLRLQCPSTEIGGEVKRWKHRYYLDENENPKIDRFRKEESEDSVHTSWQLIVPPHPAVNYSSVYSCQTLHTDCWHHFYVVTKPYPRTTRHIQFSSGSDGNFSCWARNTTKDGKEHLLINLPPLSISWKYPGGKSTQPANIKIVPTFRIVNGTNSPWDSQIRITNASQELHAGIYECVIVDKFGVPSTPESINETQADDVHLPSGLRYSGFAHVHIRPTSYVFIPIGITIILCCILPVMVRFCPTAANEADLEEEETGNVKENPGIYSLTKETDI